MPTPSPLTVAQVYRRCPPEALDFETTEDLEELDVPCGQERVLRALEFGARVQSGGFNMFVLGPPGVNKHELVTRFLRRQAETRPLPPDWCLVYNFDNAEEPAVLRFPAGEGRAFCSDMDELADELRTAIPAAFESEEYQARIQELQEEAARRQHQGLREIQREANRNNIAMMPTPAGFTFAPMRNGEVIDPEEYKTFSDEEKQLIEAKVEELQKRLQQTIQQIPRLRKEMRERVHALNEEIVELTLGGPIGELRQRWSHLPDVVAYLQAVQEDIVEHAEAFQDRDKEPPASLMLRYKVNLLVDNSETRGAPVIYEDLPNVQHLIGQIEYRAHQGTLYTDFTLVKPGAFHRANGGYLIVDARRVLAQPLAWDSLKRVLFSGEIRIESLERLYGLVSTASLKPAPIPVSTKVVLLGDRMLYYLLSHYDPDFSDLFKVEADFEDDLDWDGECHTLYARMIASLARSVKARPLTREGVARLIEHASRLASDQRKLTGHDRVLRDLLSEADHWAGEDGAEQIGATHVQKAIDEREYRAGRIRERSMEQISRGIVQISTTGTAVGQVNGLSVLRLGASSFGQPTRITATARPGKGQVVDIEREAKLGGPIHSKAVMILSRFLASRYAADQPLSLSASLAFEQSYGGVEGDSASVAETCVLLSAIAGVPLKQNLAVTGSMNQHGEVQAVGGVNEKVEGFFRVCEDAGGATDHGVLLPATNVQHLMLGQEVRDAMEAGRFRLYPLTCIDEAIELLTGMEAGEPDAQGRYPEGTFNRRVQDRLAAFAEADRHRGADGKEGDSKGAGADGD